MVSAADKLGLSEDAGGGGGGGMGNDELNRSDGSSASVFGSRCLSFDCMAFVNASSFCLSCDMANRNDGGDGLPTRIQDEGTMGPEQADYHQIRG